jgi:hypothetical protein
MANKKVVPLTDTEIKTAKPREKEYTLPDGNGLQLVIKTDGRKIWEVRYTINSKPKQTTIGTYPAVTLAKARIRRDELKGKVLNGIDPIQEKKEIKATIQAKEMEVQTALNTQFHLITYEWLSTLKSAEITATKRKRAFERDIFPHLCTYDEHHKIISSKQIGEITHGELLKIITEKGKATF